MRKGVDKARVCTFPVRRLFKTVSPCSYVLYGQGRQVDREGGHGAWVVKPITFVIFRRGQDAAHDVSRFTETVTGNRGLGFRAWGFP